MLARLTELNRNEILMYLGHKGQDITPDFSQQLADCEQKVLSVATPRLTYRILPVKSGRIEGFADCGKDVYALLADCNEVILFAATLGPGVETLLLRTEITNMADALIMDACASVVIENICNNFEADFIETQLDAARYLTDRFSPGYGDFPLSLQPLFCDTLDAGRRIGLQVTNSLLLTPRKSVTALIGISNTPTPHRARGCETCSMFLTCKFRKDGITCHG